MRIHQIAAYAWAAPNSILGLTAACIMTVCGAQSRVSRGTLEVVGGWVGAVFASPAIACPFRAITLGHVILATDSASLDCARTHEHVHVRQYEQWGPFFLPAYVVSSLWQLACGRRCYRDNWFERQAYERS